MRRAPRSAEEQARYQEARQRAHDNWGRVLGVLIVPGGRIWRRSPALGAALLIAGVVAPVFALGMVVKNRNDLTGFVNSGTTLRWLGVVGAAALAARVVAVLFTAPTVAYRARLGFLSRGLLSVGVLAVPTVFGVLRLEDARTVVTEMFNQAKGVTKVTAAKDDLSDQVHTVLLLGSDAGFKRPGIRTDTMMLAFIHKKSGRSAVVSIPRGLAHLRFPPKSPMGVIFPNGYTDKAGSLTNAINSYVMGNRTMRKAYERGDGLPGIHALLEGISYSFDVTIDDYVMVNSCAFVKLIDSLGGVVVDIPKALPLPHGHFDCLKYQVGETIGPGRVVLNGTQAFGFVRTRKADSDFQRMARQRQLLQALAQQISFAEVLSNFSGLVDAVKDDIKTSLDIGMAKKLGEAIKKNPNSVGGLGLVPPLFKQSEPDWAKGHDILQGIKQSLISGEVNKQVKTLGTQP